MSDLPLTPVTPLDELGAVTQLENLRDAVRFRIDGLRPDLLRERPQGYARSMVEVISAYLRGEQAFEHMIKQVAEQDQPQLKTSFAFQPSSYVQFPYEDVGALMKLREQALGGIRRMEYDGWDRTMNDPEVGIRTLREVVIARANSDKEFLEVLEHMRYTLQGSMRPFTRTISGGAMPDSTR